MCIYQWGYASHAMPVEYGVVQGSMFGPILYLLNINNLSRLVTNGKFFLFADDTLILI